MNIILGQDSVKSIDDRYIVLRLDSFLIAGQNDPIVSYCLVENIPVHEIKDIEQWQELHENLMENYEKRNWNFCQQSIEHLMGRWNGELDSFYQDLLMRVDSLQKNDPGPSWSPVIDRQNKGVVC